MQEMVTESLAIASLEQKVFACSRLGDLHLFPLFLKYKFPCEVFLIPHDIVTSFDIALSGVCVSYLHNKALSL